MTSTDKFVGFLVSVECRDFFYQGIVTQIDQTKALIQLKNVFQNGIHCGSKLVDIKTTEIDNIEIIADPQDALKMLQPKSTQIEHSPSFNKLTDETNKLVAQQQNNNFLKPNDNNNNNHINNNKNTSSQSLKVTKHAKTSSNHQNAHNKSTSNISPASVSPPYYQQNDSNKRKTGNPAQNSNGYSNGHINNITTDSNSMSVDAVEEDFDFEQNLALFDKNKFYDEVGHPILNNSSCMTPNEPQLNAYDSLVRQLNSNKEKSSSSQSGYRQISVANLFAATTPQITSASASSGLLTPNTNGLILNSTTTTTSMSIHKTPSLSNSSSRNYRFDEMVLGTGEPVNLQQIQVPCNLGKYYVTDDGFVVPCIDADTRQKLFEHSYSYGFTKQRQIECMGRCCTEMAIQLIGGPLRFSPKNNHQKPTILILINEHSLQGSYAILTARFLSIRSCKVHIYVAKSTMINKEDSDLFNTELSLFQSTEPSENTFLKTIDELRTITPPDLIINSLDITSTNQPWFRTLVKYIDSCKASVLSIDPVAEGTAINSKWCVLPVLPKAMSEACGRVYLCDLGFTKNMFSAVNIKYQSPFGAKFLIPLHND
jgi:hypothetical protein